MEVAPVTLAGTFVRLEPLSLDHLPGLCEAGLDPATWARTMPHIRNETDMRADVEDALRLQELGTALPFATVEAARGRVVGSTRFGNIDRPNRRVEIGWTWIATAFQRTP